MTVIKKPQPAAVMSLRLNADTIKALDALANRLKTSRTDVMTAALLAHIAKQQAPAKKPATPVIRASEVFKIPAPKKSTKLAQVKK